MRSAEPDSQSGLHRKRKLPVVVLSAALIGTFLCVLAITFLANTVRSEVDALAVANSDTTQWSLVQTEVELLALQLAISNALKEPVPDLDEVRRRYDIFFSRVRLIEQSNQFGNLREDPKAVASMAKFDDFLDVHTALLDGSDSALIAHLPALASEVESLRATGRAFSLLGVQVYAADSDAKREGVATTLASIGYLTLLLVLALMAGIGILLAMFRRSIQAERGAADARNRLEEVIATSLDGIIATDADGRVIEYNGAAERVFGYTRKETIGHDMADLIVPDHLRAAHIAGMKRYRSTRERHVVGKGLVRLEARRKDGTVFPVEMSLSSATFNGTEIFVSFLRDISDRVAAEHELILARDHAVAGELAKARLLAVMSHEMRTPLNGILGTIELMRYTTLSSRQNRLVAAMKTSAGLLLHHVNGVLSMSRAEAGQLDLVATEVDPANLLEELVESQRPAIEAHGNQITCNLSNAPDRILVDQLRLRQVILNLVGNANKFTRRGEILVECDTIAGSNQVEIRVIDTGIGIADADLDRIFDEFQTLDTSYSRTAEGTGLGLAISRRLVTAMGGEIGVDSELGEGSIFWVRLPIGEFAERETRDRSPDVVEHALKGPAEQARQMSVLLVEDNQINRLVAREMLQMAGHQVIEAHDGREGVRLAGMQPFDAILMDISMPELDGVAATRIIRETDGPNCATPIIALTAHALPEDTRRFLAAGINDTLLKPLSLATLQKALTKRDKAIRMASAATPQISTVFDDLSRQLGHAKAAHLLSTFRAEAEALMGRISSSAWTSDAPQVRADAVHKLAGSASVLGAADFRVCLQALETNYRSGQDEAAEARLIELTRAWAEARDEVDRCIDAKI